MAKFTWIDFDLTNPEFQRQLKDWYLVQPLFIPRIGEPSPPPSRWTRVKNWLRYWTRRVREAVGFWIAGHTLDPWS